MLFSQPSVASFLSETFECAWQSVRPAPHVVIDFGNGHTLERTLRGNIATYVCTSRGETVDLVAGLVDAAEYTARLRQTARLFERVRAARDEHARWQLVAYWHSARAMEPPGVPPPPPAGVLPPDYWRMSCFAVERPLEQALIPPLSPTPFVLELGESGLQLVNTSFGATRASAAPLPFALSKVEIERPLEAAVAAPTAVDRSGLERDTNFAREQGHRLAHAFLALRALKTPAALTKELYRELLHVDLDDPYLGLAPNVLGGELGRH